MCSLTFLVLPASFAVTTCVGLLLYISIVLQYRRSNPVSFTYIVVFKLLTFNLVVSECSGIDILYFVLLKPFGFAESIRRGVRPWLYEGGGEEQYIAQTNSCLTGARPFPRVDCSTVLAATTGSNIAFAKDSSLMNLEFQVEKNVTCKSKCNKRQCATS